MVPTQLPQSEQGNGKRKAEDEPFQPRKTRGKRVDYRFLNDPFPDELDEQGNLIITPNDNEIYAIIAGDEHNSLKEAKASFDWPEWERAMRIEYDQHLEMGAWKLVDPPSDAVPGSYNMVF
jgi:hypothetical protein